MTFDQLFQTFSILKIIFLIIFFLYFGFSFVVLNQVRTMNRVLTEIHSSTALRMIAFLNLIFAISLFLIATVIL